MALSPVAQLLSCKDKQDKKPSNSGKLGTKSQAITCDGAMECCRCGYTHTHTHLPSATEAGHPVALAQVVEARLGQLSGGDDRGGPGVERVQALLLPAHVGVVAGGSLVGHVLHAARAQRAGGRWGGEAHVQITHWLFTLAGCCVGGGGGDRGGCSGGKLDDGKARGLSYK